MRVYIGHATCFDYQNELYKIIRNDNELKNVEIILPHEQGYDGNSTREFYDTIDLFICEVSYKATGLGIELGFAYDSKVPIYCIYKKGSNVSSALKVITNNFLEYDSKEVMLQIIKDIIKKEKAISIKKLLEEANEKAKIKWDKTFNNWPKENIEYDDWLVIFDELIEKCKTPIIDLGCGCGNTTLYLTEKGKEVIPCDFSDNAIKSIMNNFPEVKRCECFDMTEGFLFEENFTDLIIADLSLHYFTEEKTFFILNEIKRVLKPNGILLFRVNSTSSFDKNKTDAIEIEHNLYKLSNGIFKRFFDKESIDKFFKGFKIVYTDEYLMGRYGFQKELWRGAVKAIK